MKHKELHSVLAKPSGPDCNMDCDYCFYTEKAELYHRASPLRMDEKTLQRLIQQVVEQSGPSVTFCWQGGEPTLMGVPFFEKVVALQKEYGSGKFITNSLQTNGLLIDEKWADFLVESNWLVGVSLDGPKYIHDRYRLTKNGFPSWEIVNNNARMLLEKGVAVNVLSCLTDHSSNHIAEIYSYFKNSGFTYMQFIPVVGTGHKKSRKYSLSSEKYGELLIQLWDLWIADFNNGIPTTSIRYFDAIFYTYVGLPAPDCTMQKECGTYTVIEHNGDVYSCDFFVEPKWKLGNIKDGQLITMLNSGKQKEFGRMKTSLPTKCSKCIYLKQCFGGCTKERMEGTENNGASAYCSAYLAFFRHADAHLKKMAKQWVQNQIGSQKNINIK